MNTIRSKSLIALGTAMLAGGLFCTGNVVAGQSGRSDSTSHEGNMMQQRDSMDHDSMRKNGMKHDMMGKDTMGHGSMGKDAMGKDTTGKGTGKHDSKGGGHMMQNGDDN